MLRSTQSQILSECLLRAAHRQGPGALTHHSVSPVTSQFAVRRNGRPGPCSFARHGLAERRLVWPPNTTHLCHQLSFRTVTAALQLTSEKICFYFYCYGLSLSLAASSEQHENRRSKTARRTKARDRNDARESEPGRRPSFAKLIIE